MLGLGTSEYRALWIIERESRMFARRNQVVLLQEHRSPWPKAREHSILLPLSSGVTCSWEPFGGAKQCLLLSHVADGRESSNGEGTHQTSGAIRRCVVAVNASEGVCVKFYRSR